MISKSVLLHFLHLGTTLKPNSGEVDESWELGKRGARKDGTLLINLVTKRLPFFYSFVCSFIHSTNM